MRIPSYILVGSILAFTSCASADVRPAKQPQSIFLTGRFSVPYEKDQVSAHLRKMGFDVRTQMTNDVALVLVGNNPVNDAGDGFIDVEATDDYRRAAANGATLLRLRDLADLVTSPTAVFAARGARSGR